MSLLSFVGLTNEILINGTTTSRTLFCVGDRLTLVCRNETLAYSWIIPIIGGGQITVALTIPEITVDDFTARYISMTESQLQFVVSNDLNGITFICRDFFTGFNISTTNLLVLGKMFIVFCK